MMSSNRGYRFLSKEPASREDTVCSPTQPRAVERKLISAEAKHITRRFHGYAASQSVAKAAIVDCSLTKDELISCHLATRDIRLALERESGRRSPIFNPELRINPLKMFSHGRGGDAENCANLSI